MNPPNLDWSDSTHWSNRPRLCSVCGAATHLLDDSDGPAHKVCIEHLLERLEVA